MVIVINDNRVTDVKAYLPLAKAFAEESVRADRGCRSMEVTIDPQTEGRVVFVSHFDSAEDFRSTIGGATFSKHIPEMSKYFISAKDTILEVISTE